MTVNITAAWIGFLLGAISGAIPGLFFHKADWLGGYTSWPRRLVRLAHISFFGIGFLNLALGLTSHTLGITAPVASSLLIVAAATMPASFERILKTVFPLVRREASKVFRGS